MDAREGHRPNRDRRRAELAPEAAGAPARRGPAAAGPAGGAETATYGPSAAAPQRPREFQIGNRRYGPY